MSRKLRTYEKINPKTLVTGDVFVLRAYNMIGDFNVIEGRGLSCTIKGLNSAKFKTDSNYWEHIQKQGASIMMSNQQLHNKHFNAKLKRLLKGK